MAPHQGDSTTPDQAIPVSFLHVGKGSAPLGTGVGLARWPCSSMNHQNILTWRSSVVVLPASSMARVSLPYFSRNCARSVPRVIPLSGKECERSILHTDCLFGGKVTSTVTRSLTMPIMMFCVGAETKEAMTGFSMVGRLVDMTWILFLGSSV